MKKRTRFWHWRHFWFCRLSTYGFSLLTPLMLLELSTGAMDPTLRRWYGVRIYWLPSLTDSSFVSGYEDSFLSWIGKSVPEEAWEREWGVPYRTGPHFLPVRPGDYPPVGDYRRCSGPGGCPLCDGVITCS